jgi:thiol-disulfide isomerase/thioredoxin
LEYLRTIMKRRELIALGLGSAAALKLEAAPKLPRPAGEFVIRLASRELVLLSQFKGKPVVMELLMTTCPHCQRSSSLLQKLSEELGSQVQFLGAAFNEGADMAIASYVAGLRLKFPVGTATRDSVYDFLQLRGQPGPVYVPQMVFIDRAGIVRAQYGGDSDFFKDEENNIRKEIAELLKTARGPRAAAKK